MSKESLSVLVSYLEHLDYIKQHEDGSGEQAGKPPIIPSHLREEKILDPQSVQTPEEIVQDAQQEIQTATDLN